MVLTQGQRVQAFTLLDRVGDPNMGQVWIARSDAGATVALKCISEQFRGNEDMIRRFWRECAFQMRLRHPSIVQVSDCVQHEGDLFLVMQYIRGGSLEDRLRQAMGNPLPFEEILSISSDVLHALDYAHQNGVIHRDVKPSNILLEGGRAYLTDFGVAMGMKKRHGMPSGSVGTYPYMSPEQIVMNRPTDQRSDVYGFGCVLYEMLTGRPPFPLDQRQPCSDEELCQMHIGVLAIPPNQLNSSIPERLNHVTLTALAKNPEDRFAGCGSFALAIEGAVPRPQPQPPAPTHEVSRANNIGALFVVWALALLLSGAGRNRADLNVIVLLSFAGSAAVVLRLLFKAWAAIQDSSTKTKQEKAVAFLFIPIFNLYWLWRAFAEFPAEYNAFIDRNHLNVVHESRVVYMLFTAGAWAMAVLGLLPISFVSIFLIPIQFFVMVPLVVFALTGAINRLAMAQRSAS